MCPISNVIRASFHTSDSLDRAITRRKPPAVARPSVSCIRMDGSLFVLSLSFFLKNNIGGYLSNIKSPAGQTRESAPQALSPARYICCTVYRQLVLRIGQATRFSAAVRNFKAMDMFSDNRCACSDTGDVLYRRPCSCAALCQIQHREIPCKNPASPPGHAICQIVANRSHEGCPGAWGCSSRELRDTDQRSNMSIGTKRPSVGHWCMPRGTAFLALIRIPRPRRYRHMQHAGTFRGNRTRTDHLRTCLAADRITKRYEGHPRLAASLRRSA